METINIATLGSSVSISIPADWHSMRGKLVFINWLGYVLSP